jgi:hypothetical protein
MGYQSKPIHVDGILIDVRTNEAGKVIIGKQVGDVYAADTALTPEQAMELSDYLTEGAAKCLAARGEA